MVAGSVRKRCASARTLIRTNSRGRSKAGRTISCRLGLKRLIRAEGLMTATVRLALRGFLIGHKSMLESGVLVNTDDLCRGRACPERSRRMSPPARRSRAPQDCQVEVLDLN